MYVCTQAHTLIFACMHTHPHIHTNVYRLAWLCVVVHTHNTHICTRTHNCTCIHANRAWYDCVWLHVRATHKKIHAQAHTHAHIYMCIDCGIGLRDLCVCVCVCVCMCVCVCVCMCMMKPNTFMHAQMHEHEVNAHTRTRTYIPIDRGMPCVLCAVASYPHSQTRVLSRSVSLLHHIFSHSLCLSLASFAHSHTSYQ